MHYGVMCLHYGVMCLHYGVMCLHYGVIWFVLRCNMVRITGSFVVQIPPRGRMH